MRERFGIHVPGIFRPKGYLSVFLAMIFLSVVSLVLTSLESVRVSVIRMQTEVACGLAMEAFLSQYHPQVQARYGLYLVEQDGYDGLFFGRMIRRNIQETDGKDHIRTDRLLAASLTQASVTDSIRIWDNQFAYLLDQVSDLMKQDLLTGAEPETIVSGTPDVSTLESDRQQLAAELGTAGAQSEAAAAAAAEEGNSPGGRPRQTGDPRRSLTRLLRSPILSIVCPGAISEASLQTGTLSQIIPAERDVGRIRGFMNYASLERDLAGSDLGLLQTASEIADDLLLDRYLMRCFRNASDTDRYAGLPLPDGIPDGICGESVLKYELEYILFGKTSDVSNLENAVNRLLLIRMLMNLSSLYQDGSKMALVRSAAAALAAALLIPYMEEVFALLIAAAWAYAESLVDVRILLDGGRVPLVKDAGSWKLSLESLYQMSAGTVWWWGSEDGQDGLSYTDYLRWMLLLMPADKKCTRMLNLIEANIRLEDGCGDFLLNQCAFGVSVTSDFEWSALFYPNPFQSSYVHHVVRSGTY